MFVVVRQVFAGSASTHDDVVTDCNGTIFARDIANERADVMSPQGVHDQAAAVAAAHGLTITANVGPALVQQGLNLLHAVGKSATCVKYSHVQQIRAAAGVSAAVAPREV